MVGDAAAWGAGGATAPAGVAAAYPRDVRNSSIRRASASAAMPPGAGAGAGGRGSDGRAASVSAVGRLTTAGVVSYASRLMFSRWRGEMLSDVMLPP